MMSNNNITMRKLNEKEMKGISAGAISAALVNAFSRVFNVFVDVGRYFGSSLRRIFDHNMCRY